LACFSPHALASASATAARCTVFDFPLLHALSHLRSVLAPRFSIPACFCTRHRGFQLHLHPIFSFCICAIARTLLDRAACTVDLCWCSPAQFSTAAHTGSACALEVPRSSSEGILRMTVITVMCPLRFALTAVSASVVQTALVRVLWHPRTRQVVIVGRVRSNTARLETKSTYTPQISTP
jgi:hypothetical protein